MRRSLPSDLKRAFEETDDMVAYDYLVVNDDLDVLCG